MNAAWQRLWSLVRLGGALALLALGHWGWALALLLASPLVLLLLFLTLAHDPVQPQPPSLRQRLRAWRGELRVYERVFSLDQPWRAGLQDRAMPDASGRTGVLLLHGYSCNRGLWRPWLLRLRAAQVPCSALTLEPAFGSIDSYAQAIDAAIRQLHAATSGRMPVIVAHSMGGLAARAWWRAHGAAYAQAPKLITLGTPHLGTRIGALSPATNAQQMRLGSDWLAALPLMPDVDCLWSPCDQIIQPASHACQPGARWHRVDATGHLALIDTPEAWALLQNALNAADGREGLAQHLR